MNITNLSYLTVTLLDEVEEDRTSFSNLKDLKMTKSNSTNPETRDYVKTIDEKEALKNFNELKTSKQFRKIQATFEATITTDGEALKLIFPYIGFYEDDNFYHISGTQGGEEPGAPYRTVYVILKKNLPDKNPDLHSMLYIDTFNFEKRVIESGVYDATINKTELKMTYNLEFKYPQFSKIDGFFDLPDFKAL